MALNKIRVYFLEGYRGKKDSHVDLYGSSLENINKIMSVDPEDMVGLRADEGKYYSWRRKHILRWEEIKE